MHFFIALFATLLLCGTASAGELADRMNAESRHWSQMGALQKQRREQRQLAEEQKQRDEAARAREEELLQKIEQLQQQLDELTPLGKE